MAGSGEAVGAGAVKYFAKSKKKFDRGEFCWYNGISI